MPAYLVQVPAGGGRTFHNGVNSAVVFAADTTDAVAIARSLISGGDSDVDLVGATVTAIVAAADMEGWTLRVKIEGASPAIDYTVTGAAAATIDSIAALMVTALNGDAQIAGAAYDATGNVLTVAETTDGLGDLTLLVEFKPPSDTHPNAQHIPGTVLSITDGGASGDSLEVTLAADAFVVPLGYAALAST